MSSGGVCHYCHKRDCVCGDAVVPGLDPRLLTSSVLDLCADINREPADHWLKLLLADALGDAGASERMCAGLRWPAREGKYPWSGGPAGDALRSWYDAGEGASYNVPPGSPHILPPKLIALIPLPTHRAGYQRPAYGRWFGTPSAACLALASAWERADEGLVAEWMGGVTV